MGSFFFKPTVDEPKTLFQATQLKTSKFFVSTAKEKAGRQHGQEEVIIDLTEDDSDELDPPRNQTELFEALAVANKAVRVGERKGKGKAAAQKAAEAAFFAAFPRIQQEVSGTADYRERSQVEKRRILEDAYITTQHEIQILKLVDECQGYEDFDDNKNISLLKEKCQDIRLALECLYDVGEY